MPSFGCQRKTNRLDSLLRDYPGIFDLGTPTHILRRTVSIFKSAICNQVYCIPRSTTTWNLLFGVLIPVLTWSIRLADPGLAEHRGSQKSISTLACPGFWAPLWNKKRQKTGSLEFLLPLSMSWCSCSPIKTIDRLILD